MQRCDLLQAYGLRFKGTLAWADKLPKGVAKYEPKEFIPRGKPQLPDRSPPIAKRAVGIPQHVAAAAAFPSSKAPDLDLPTSAPQPPAPVAQKPKSNPLWQRPPAAALLAASLATVPTSAAADKTPAPSQTRADAENSGAAATDGVKGEDSAASAAAQPAAEQTSASAGGGADPIKLNNSSIAHPGASAQAAPPLKPLAHAPTAQSRSPAPVVPADPTTSALPSWAQPQSLDQKAPLASAAPSQSRPLSQAAQTPPSKPAVGARLPPHSYFSAPEIQQERTLWATAFAPTTTLSKPSLLPALPAAVSRHRPPTPYPKANGRAESPSSTGTSLQTSAAPQRSAFATGSSNASGHPPPAPLPRTAGTGKALYTTTSSEPSFPDGSGGLLGNYADIGPPDLPADPAGPNRLPLPKKKPANSKYKPANTEGPTACGLCNLKFHASAEEAGEQRYLGPPVSVAITSKW